MSEKQPSYRVNFTMPRANNELNSKISELFERHRDIGNLRHWLMALATEAAQKELGIRNTPTSTTPKPAPVAVKPKKVESFADLLADDPVDSKPVKKGKKSKELEAYEDLCAAVRGEEGYDPNDTELEEALERARPLILSDYY